MGELSAFNKVKNNLLFTLDDIKLMLIVEQNIFEYSELEKKAIDIFTVLRKAYYAEQYNNKKENLYITGEIEVELIGFIAPQTLIELNETIRAELDELEYNVFNAIRNKIPTDGICTVFGLSRTSLWRIKNRINSIVYKIINSEI